MNDRRNVNLSRLSNDDLALGLELSARGERAFLIKLLHHLNEFDRRKLFLELGYSSLFDYCVRKLKYTPSAAGRRIQAARCILRHPEVLRLLDEHELDLGTISLIDPVLTEENRESILERVRGKSYREADRVVSEYRPPVALRDRARWVQVAAPAPKDIDAALFERLVARGNPHFTPGAGSGWVEQKLFVQFLASEPLVKKLEEVQKLLSQRCDGSFAEVLDIVLSEFLERHHPIARKERREARQAAAAPPKNEHHSRRRECKNTQPRTRHIAAKTRDEVFTRDGGRCAYVARDGTRCASRHALQIDHIRPYAAGGSNDPSNLRLLCAAHNRHAAERTVGKHVMERYWRRV